jgi:tRNA 2-thiouridine synthesizing protein E
MGQLDRTPQEVELDEDGFLRDPEQWNRLVAFHLACQSGVPYLEEEHWEVINQLRSHWRRHHSVAAVSHICRLSHQGPRCMDTLFPGPRDAWRIAGLPNPGEEAKSYM